ncbi:hypothetical protein [Phenylobacterium sp.]|nr:hypothetical protein [Phenylobacterium sp.]
MSRLPVTYKSSSDRRDPLLTPTRLFLAALLAGSLVLLAWVLSFG